MSHKPGTAVKYSPRTIMPSACYVTTENPDHKYPPKTYFRSLVIWIPVTQSPSNPNEFTFMFFTQFDLLTQIGIWFKGPGTPSEQQPEEGRHGLNRE